MKREFPYWMYHPEKEGVIVRSQEQLDALGSGWCHSAADFGKVECPVVESVKEEPTYQEHMAKWESKEDKKKKGKSK